METLSAKKIYVVMGQIPDSTSPRFLAQLDVLQQMGYFLRVVSLKGLPDRDNLSGYSRLKEQSLSLKLAKRQIPQAVFALLFLAISAPIKFSHAFGVMLKMLFNFKDRRQVVKNYLQAAVLVNQHIIDKEISHLHAHCECNAVRTAYLSSLLSGLNSSYLALPGEIFAPDFLLLKPALTHSAFIFLLSRYEQEALLEKIFADIDSQPTILCTLNGIDLKRFAFIHALPLPKEPYQFLTTAHLSNKKGLDTVLCALRELKDEGLKFQYRIVGDGPARKSLEDLVKILGLEDDVVFAGIKPHSEIPKFLAAADLFVLAPRVLENGEQDSIPLGIKEAMATGVPAVATDCGALGELIESEETGLLVPPEDVSAFAAACRRLLTDRELRNQVILKARLQIEGVYDIHKQAEAFNDYIVKHNIPL